MKTSLDKVEEKLQEIIESSIKLFSSNFLNHQIIHELVKAMEDSAQYNPDGSISAPAVYSIHISPAMLEDWKERQHLLSILSEELMQVASENGVRFTLPPVLRLVPDNHLAGDQIRIQTSNDHDFNDTTAAITLNREEEKKEVVDERPQNAFLIEGGSNIIPLRQTPYNIGRRKDNHLVIDDVRVSRTHAQIRAIRGQYVIIDLNSTGGTFVNSHRITQKGLKPGDVISLSGISIIYGEDYQPDIHDTDGYTSRTELDDKSNPEEIE